MQALVGNVSEPSYCFDVGSNIGLLSLPLLQKSTLVTVVAVEPSPNVLPFLRKTIRGSSHADRWHLVEEALSSKPGTLQFHVSAARDSALDGIVATGRTGSQKAVSVNATTLDDLWIRHGRPKVTLVKIDVEGHELAVLEGGSECLATEQPFIVLEWSRLNLSASSIPVTDLLHWAKKNYYQLMAIRYLRPITIEDDLDFFSRFTEDFILVPEPKRNRQS
jgi:FkbM family methyltransferase